MKKIKLNPETKAIILMDIGMVIFTIVIAIVTKNSTWIVCSALWADIAIIQYLDAKLLKSKDELFNILDKLIEKQNEIIIEQVREKENTKIVMLKDIKIPPDYKKPAKVKMNARIEYFKHFQDFRVPVIIDKHNNLIDGYTSYLIAKNMGHNCISVRMK